MASRSLGTLTLDLIAKIGGFEAGMTKAERASSRASKKIADDAERAAAKTKAAFKTIGVAAAAAFGGLSIAGVFSAVIDNTKQMENEQAQLAAALKSTGEAAGFTRDEMNDMANSLASKSLFNAGDINQAQTALVAFTGVIGGEFVRAQQAAADMAARTGMSIQSATETIGRALDVPSAGMAALSRQGFRFSDEQKKLMVQLEATGKTAEAQGIILDALEESYGGAALAARETFGGAIEAVRNTIGGLATGQEGSLESARLAVEEFNDSLSSPEAAAAFGALVSGITSGASILVKALTAIPWGLVADGAKLLAAVLATRLVVSVGTTTASIALGTVEAIKYQAALARMAGASTTAATGLGTLTVAARAASGAMALLGGPVGLAILAASALAYFAISAGDSNEETNKLSSSVDVLNQSFDGFTKNQAAAALLKINEELVQAKLKAIDAGTAVQHYTGLLRNYPDDKRAREWNESLIIAKGALDTAEQAVASLGKKIEQLNGIIASTDVSRVGDAASKTYEDLAAKINERILLHGKETESARFAARVEAGLVEGLKEGEAEKLIALYKTDEALQAQSKAQKEREAAAKSAANAAASAAKAAIERAQAEAKAVQDSVDALVRQSEQLGWTTEAIKLYDLEAKGASGTQLQLASAALEATKAFQEQEKVNAEAKGVIEGLQTEEEQIRASYERRKELILGTTLKTAEEKAELLRRLDEETNEALLGAGDDYWSRYLAAAEKSLSSFDELAGSAIDNMSTRFGSAVEAMVFDSENLGDAMQKLAQGMARSVVNALGQMAAQWLAYQAVQLFVGKSTQATGAAAIAANAQATALQAGLAAFASTAAIPIVGPAAAPAAMATALTIATPLATAVGLTAMAGMAHDGIDSVPQTGTWLLEKGERVVTSKTSAKLDATLSRIDSNKGQGDGDQGKAPIVNIYENPQRAGEVESQFRDERYILSVFVNSVRSGTEAAVAIESTYGSQRVGR